ncbi:MAG TPA: hypothetical protein VGJ10_03960, partial [Paraburkholderia sp.]
LDRRWHRRRRRTLTRRHAIWRAPSQQEYAWQPRNTRHPVSQDAAGRMRFACAARIRTHEQQQEIAAP